MNLGNITELTLSVLGLLQGPWKRSSPQTAGHCESQILQSNCRAED